MKIAFITQSKHPEMEDDDRPLAAALAKRGALVLSVSWDDPDFAWDRVDLALLRSPWDYYLRFDEFLTWLARVEKETSLVNPAGVVRWNADKRYLNDLISKGVSAVPTTFVARGESENLERLCSERGWSTVVLKPAISADSWETIRVEPARYAEGQAYLDRHRPDRDIMVQPFVRDVDEGGEQCLIFFGGRYSHTVMKNSAFKGGRHVGPEGRLVEPKADAVRMAHDVLVCAGIPQVPYARVDIARDDNGAPLLLELELFEPTLFFKEKPGSEEALSRILMP
jgi:glutathione synthase/RimK-type ligase-like ATP-grasp enzyme